jgi:hypothetical protein
VTITKFMATLHALIRELRRAPTTIAKPPSMPIAQSQPLDGLTV